VKFLRASHDRFIFHVGKREKALLFETLGLYPLVPPARQRLSRTAQGPGRDENQRLLEDALADHRAANRKRVLAMLDEPQRFRETKTGFEFALSPAQAEWLLQVLNDVRVGSWIALGEPDDLDLLKLDETNASSIVALEGAGYFEAMLMAGLSEGSSLPPPQT
jgi:hypothetical protein